MPKKTKFIRLKEIFNILHGPKGCPWDRKQTFDSVIRHLREETREYIQAVKSRNYRHMKEELGDILLLVMFNAQMAQKKKKFDIEDVIDGLSKKLVRRHPHVFGKLKLRSARQVIMNWNKIKKSEGKRKK
ncbi:MAG: MazG nucleotide pyrophosphohydrolase domain-containing protein [Candidatus Omnitrophota bacterium]